MAFQAPQKPELYALHSINQNGCEEIYLTEAMHFQAALESAQTDLGQDKFFDFEIVTPIN